MPPKDASSYIANLNKKRSEWLDITRRNNFEDGIYRLLSEMYPDQAHFIYELLQNAEDAEASVVQFKLSKNSLKVTHDGKRLFNSSDVESITSIGKSTKKDDLNQIGKFGVGFKAVFAYTSSPKIYSGLYNFVINDLICPSEIEPIKMQKDETVFQLPFNNPDKRPDICFNEISDVFKSMENIILLFLNHIEVIEWEIEDYGEGIVIRTQQNHIHPSLILISNSEPSNEKEQVDSWYIRFQKKLPGHDKLECSVALKLAFRKSAQKQYNEKYSLSDQMKIILDNGNLCIFFPAEKETTGLKFHINGPFASTIDRASISHKNEDNISILNTASELLIDSMAMLKTLNLINASFLSTLPNDNDQLSDFYATIRNKIYEALQTNEIIPTLDGKYAITPDLARGPKNISEFLSNNDLSFLSQRNGTRWALNVMRNERPDKLLKSVGIPNWNNNDLVQSVHDLFWPLKYRSNSDNESEQSPIEWLINKKIEWITQFYLLLWSAAKKASREYSLKYLPIILTQNNTLLEGNEVYFPPKGNNNNELGLNIVNKGLFQKLDKPKLELLNDFLIKVGVNEISESEEIEFILDSYYRKDSPDPTIKQHHKHINKFIAYSSRLKDFSLFENAYIFFDIDDSLHTAAGCYIDKPFSNTGLEHISEIIEKKPLSPHYIGVDGIVNFAKSVGVQSTLNISKIWIKFSHPDYKQLKKHSSQRHSEYSIDQDFDIDSLDAILEKPTVQTSKLVWNTIISAKEYQCYASYRPNKQYDTQLAFSTLVYKLRKHNWIASKDGSFYQPIKMTKDLLLDNFIYDNRNGWLKAILFGQDEIKKTAKYKEKQQKAKDLGISIEDAELIKNHREDFLKWKKEKLIKNKTSIFPQKQSKNPERRKSKFGIRLQKAHTKQYEKKERSVRTTKDIVNPKEYLLGMYTNGDGEMFCQLCQQELSKTSFKKRNGEYYFDRVEILSKNLLKIEEDAQFIALCPLCSAKFREHIKKEESASQKFQNLLLNAHQVESDNFQVTLELGNEKANLRFVELHYNDMHQALSFNETE